MKYYLGVDIGNTNTRWILANERGELVAGLGGKGANPQTLGIDASVSYLRVELKKVLGKAQISANDLAFVYLGIAGADTAKDFSDIRDICNQVFIAAPFDFENDGLIALKNGAGRNQGIVVTCGTGNTNFAINQQGEYKRIGGWCEYMGDVLGAANIARYTISVAVRAQEGRDLPTLLTGHIIEHLELETIFDLINIEITPELAKSIITILLELATEGDGMALEITWHHAKEVLRIVEIFASRHLTKDEPFTLILDGPLYTNKNSSIFLKMIRNAMQSRYDAKIVIPEYPAVLGALFFAFEKDGVDMTDALISNIRKTYRQRDFL